MSRKTVAQWRRDDPAFAAMIADVERLRKAWPGTHSVAHRDEKTGAVTFHLHIHKGDLDRLDALLGNVEVTEMHDLGAPTFHLHGTRAHMNRLLTALRSSR